MLKINFTLWVFSLFIAGIWAQNLKVAVVDFGPKFHDDPVTPELRLLHNTAQYVKLATDNVEAYDIIVFPESTLHAGVLFQKAANVFPFSTIVPERTENVVACDSSEIKYATFFKELSCLAKNLQKVIVVNLAEHVPCDHGDGCPEDGYNVYNTNVALDTNGKVIAKYRKFNLFGEVYMSKPVAELVTFDVKGTKFGMFTCFDIMFKEPAIDLVKNLQIKAIVFPLMWFSELPFLTALQSQRQWSQELDVLLLAAGANNPWVGSGGSGIYKGKEGPVVSHISSKPESKVLSFNLQRAAFANKSETVSTLTIDSAAKEMDSFVLLQDNLNAYTSELLDVSKRHVETQICSGEEPNKICCDFHLMTELDNDIHLDKKNHYKYRLVAYSGVRSFSGVATGGIEVCAIVACKDSKLETCGQRFKDYDTVSWPLTFTTIDVKATFPVDEKRMQYPNSLLSNIQPLPVENSEWATRELTDSIIERAHMLRGPQSRLMTFGIYGRDFNRDGNDAPPPGGNDEDDDSEGGAASAFNFGSVLIGCLLFILNICCL